MGSTTPPQGNLKIRSKPVIGMLHLHALPGSSRYQGSMDDVRALMLHDAESLVNGGVHQLMIENFGDVPFYPDCAPACVVSHMTALASEVRKRFPEVPLGINVLRNDGRSALAVAHAVGANFIRVNVLCGARVTDQGIIQGIAHDLMRDRAGLFAHDIKVYADIDVKHSVPLAARPIEDDVDDTIHRGLADAVIVSGAGTGKPTDLNQLQAVKRVARSTPVFVGSGVDAQTIGSFIPHCDGVIVGTAFKKGGMIDVERVREFMKAYQSASIV